MPDFQTCYVTLKDAIKQCEKKNMTNIFMNEEICVFPFMLQKSITDVLQTYTTFTKTKKEKVSMKTRTYKAIQKKINRHKESCKP